ncbi:MAG: response regulator transcription factor [Endomicrobium sp.]|jgi:DNA-binding response OmpR family regulator|nr:response regulator transcription factor [Endomicrobium sp.]
MSKIMIVDDDGHIRELAHALLKRRGFEICEAIDGSDALKKMIENPDLVIVDVMMPKMDGFELCRRLREDYENLPILMLTAKDGLQDKVEGFEIGADDYLTKPFASDELIARVKALLRRYKIEASNMAQIGNVVIDRNGYTIIVNGVKEDIPMKEFELLFKLASFPPGRTFARDVLIEDIWGIDFDGNERTLDVHINRLRERFSQKRYHFKITTIRGLGYRLDAIT